MSFAAGTSKTKVNSALENPAECSIPGCMIQHVREIYDSKKSSLSPTNGDRHCNTGVFGQAVTKLSHRIIRLLHLPQAEWAVCQLMDAHDIDPAHGFASHVLL